MWVLALLPFVLLVLLNWGPGPPGNATDSYHYLLHGRALAEGSGYSNTGYIFTGLNPWIGPRVQPPGMAIFLYPALKLFGANVLLMRLMIVASAIAFLLLAGRCFARREGLHMGLSVTLLVGLIPTLAVFASHTYSDLVSAASLWAVICLVDSGQPFGAKKLTLITVFGSMAMMTRLTGVSLIAALFLYAVAHYRELGWRPFLPLAIWLVGGVVALLVVGPIIPIWALDGFARIQQWVQTLSTYRLGLFEIMLYPFTWDLANDLYHLAGFGFVLLGLAAWIREGWDRFVTLFVVSYVVMMAALPISGGGRYLWPIAPFVLFGLLNGVKTAVRLLVPGLKEVRLERVVLATAVVLALMSAARLALIPRQLALIEDPAVQEIVRYVRTMDAGGGTRIVFEYPRLLTWETRVPAMGLPRRSADTTVERVAEEMRSQRITHVVSLERTPLSESELLVREVLGERPRMFALVHQGILFAVYEIE